MRSFRPGSGHPRAGRRGRCTCARCASCARRGVARAALRRSCCWHIGIALRAIGLLLARSTRSATTLLSAHMAQHLLLADLGAPLLLAGCATRCWSSILPRPVLVPLARSPLAAAARSAACASRSWRCRSTRSCLYTLALLVLLRGRRAPPARARAPARELHRVGMLVWWSALEPKRRQLPASCGRSAYIFGARMIGMFLGMASCSSACRSTPASTAPATASGICRAGRPADRRRA